MRKRAKRVLKRVDVHLRLRSRRACECKALLCAVAKAGQWIWEPSPSVERMAGVEAAF